MIEKKTIQLLGRSGKDKVTGFSGVITSVGFDLYGCIQVILSPPTDKEGKIQDGRWFDVNRIECTGDRVMPVPEFSAMATEPEKYTHGAADKPVPQ